MDHNNVCATVHQTNTNTERAWNRERKGEMDDDQEGWWHSTTERTISYACVREITKGLVANQSYPDTMMLFINNNNNNMGS